MAKITYSRCTECGSFAFNSSLNACEACSPQRTGANRDPHQLAAELKTALLTGKTQQAKAILETPGTHHLVPDKDGWTAAHFAAAIGNLEILQALILKGVDLELKDYTNGWTVLHYAAAHGYTHLVDPLLLAGAAPNSLSKSKNTPIHIAAQYSHAEIVSKLIDGGADPNVPNGDGKIPLMVCIDNDSTLAARALIKGGADLSAGGDQSATALHWAIAERNVLMANLLISEGAPIDLPDSLGWTPVFLAKRRGMGEILSILLERGASRQAVIDGKNVTL